MNTVWPKTAKEAVQLQRELTKKLILEDAFESLQWLGGMDVSNFLFDPSQRVYASAVVLSSSTLGVCDSAAVVEKQSFPYISGLLGFREAPALLHAWEKLTIRPDLIMVDGHGISHPRRLGIASHIGVLLDLPTIGVAKSILCGEPAGSLGDAPGSQTPLLYKGDVVGMLVRTKKNCNPLIISPGHRISLKTSIDLVLQTLTKYRLPETTRQAHLAANAFRQRTHAQSLSPKNSRQCPLKSAG